MRDTSSDWDKERKQKEKKKQTKRTVHTTLVLENLYITNKKRKQLKTRATNELSESITNTFEERKVKQIIGKAETASEIIDRKYLIWASRREKQTRNDYAFDNNLPFFYSIH